MRFKLGHKRQLAHGRGAFLYFPKGSNLDHCRRPSTPRLGAAKKPKSFSGHHLKRNVDGGR